MKAHLVFLAAVSWECPLAGRTRWLAEGLSRLGHSVTFVSMPGIRSYFKPRDPHPSIETITMPPLPSWLRGDALEKFWISKLLQKLPRRGPVIFVASSPWWASVIASLNREFAVCYDWLDDVGVHAGPRLRSLERLQEAEQRILECSNLVITVSTGLEAEALRFKERTQVLHLPNGVPQNWLQNHAPLDRRTLGLDPQRPIAGFLGALFEWVDLYLIAQAAQRLPQWQWVLVGPKRRGIDYSGLLRQENVSWVPAIAHRQAPSWIGMFDVCLIPFKRNRVTALADPIKVYEYCALGKPVVSTIAPSPTVPIRSVATLDEFIAAVPEEASRDDASARLHRRRFAAAHTWEQRAYCLSQALDNMLQPSRSLPAIACESKEGT